MSVETVPRKGAFTEVGNNVIDARAFWALTPGQGAIRTAPLSPPAPGEVRVRTLYSGVSRGTEALVFQGRVPESQWSTMRCPFQEGAFPYPVKYGYSSVGVVEAGPDPLVGRTVFCLFPHQDRYRVPADSVVPVPDAVPAGRAVLAANMETALNGLWDAAPGPGDRIAVVGAGVVGLMVGVLAAAIPGTRVQMVDIDPGRAAPAAALGLELVAPEAAADGCDLVVHTSASAGGLATALRLAGLEATVLEMSWYGDAAPAAPLGEAFHSRRLRLISSQVGMVADRRRVRWSYHRRLALALDLLAETGPLGPRLDVLISGESAFEALPETMAALTSGSGGVLCHRVRYDGA